ncbi:MAG: acyl-CoA dehydrogenase family protein [Peptococcaceae bacterium]|nr:acyl-CoA dehydrogenase family protein [Peptococcaceae bacterium]MDH7524379.1 acyl-CoA dehydrogenase family protein [Peptococcaceae bacterium]
MDFAEGRALQMLREMCREFAEKEVLPYIDELKKKPEFPYHITKRMGDLGLIGLTIGEKYGGNMMGHVAAMVAIEELAYHYPSLGTHLRGYRLVPQVIEHHGNEEQKERFLPRLARGEIMGSLATTEASGGSAPNVCATTCRREGDYYIVNGRKVMITRGKDSHVVLISAREGDKIHCLAVEKDMPGRLAGRRETMAGVSSVSPVDEIIFEDMKVPVANRIGAEGKGLGPLLDGIGAVGRHGGAGTCLGIARWAYDVARKYAKERMIGGKQRLLDISSVRHMLADMDTRVEQAKLLCYRFAWLLDQGIKARDCAREGAMAKLVASETAVYNCYKAIEIHGGYGTTEEFKIIGRLHTALDMVSAAGADNIMRNTIALAQDRD